MCCPAGQYESCQQSAAPRSAEGQAGNAWHDPAPVATSIGSTTTSVPETTRSPAPLQQPQQPQQQAPGSSPLPPTAQTQPQQPQFPPGVKLDVQRPPSVLQQQPQQPQQQQQQTAQRNGVPTLLSDLVVPFENVRQKVKPVSADLESRSGADFDLYLHSCFRREQLRTAWRTWTKCTSCSMEGTRTCRSRKTPRSEYIVFPFRIPW